MQITNPRMQLDPAIIKKIHGLLCTDDDGSYVGHAKLGDQLLHKDVGFFLEICHHLIPSADTAPTEMLKAIRKTLIMTEIHMHHIPATPVSTLSVQGVKAGNMEMTEADIYEVVKCVRDYVRLDKYHQKILANHIANIHGGILHQGNLRDFMSKLGQVINDRVAPWSRFEQLAALHSLLYTATARDKFQELKLLDEFLQEVLMADRSHWK